MRKPVADALSEAAVVLQEARREAEAVLADAQRSAAGLHRDVREQARQNALAELATAWVNLRQEEAAKDERDLERTIELARVMAERIIGEALSLEPRRILLIARQALASVRQARDVTVLANPEDAKVLSEETGALGLERAVVRIRVDAERPRGSLLLQTDLGTLDADLSLQLDRLVAALRRGLAGRS